LAIANGYDVTMEKSGETPDGEKWIADVFRQKDKVKLAIEVQWSHQTNAGFVRRQNKYAASGVRAAWIFKLSGNKLYRNNELPYDQATPVFGIKYRPNTKDLFVPQFDKSIEDFVDGMLSGKLNWGPILGEKLYCEIIFDNIQCWKCNKITGFISGIMIRDLFYNKISYEPFSSQEVSIFVTQNINNLQLAGLGIG
jgi:competence protein CoiA